MVARMDDEGATIAGFRLVRRLRRTAEREVWVAADASGAAGEAVAGIEYNADCWVLRIVGQRLTTTTQQTTTSVFVQLELNGLARVGTSPLELLRRSEPGYLPTNDPSLRDRDRRLDPLPEF